MPEEPIKTCVELQSPTPFPAMAPILPGTGPLSPEVEQAVMLISRKWPNGKVLRVTFMDGDPQVQRRVEEMAHTWSRYANIRFKFGDDPDAEIRISFTQRGSWSYIGKDALSIPKSQPTMNFGWLTPDTPDSEYRRVVVHEFGHALGLVHEHQNPAAGIPWNKPAVYDYYSGPPNNWTKKQVDINLFQKYDEDQTNHTKFDPKSIMLYPIPNEFTIGDFEVGWNKKLSETDKRFIATKYPKPANELIVDDPPREAEISQPGEVDLYTFLVTQKGDYRLETEGRTDLVMTLYGPEDDTLFIAADDDSGRRLNPRIVRELDWGEYTIRLHHFSKARIGPYKIGVYRETSEA